MARDFSYAFYHSKQWKETRNSYMRAGDGLCEKCLKNGIYKPARIVHHLVHLTPENINDTSITLSFDNLERVCYDCHAEEHPEIYKGKKEENELRISFDSDGNVIRKESDNDSSEKDGDR